jgi:hypothetical protein
MAVEVIFKIASRSLMIVGSGTLSIRTSFFPCQHNASCGYTPLFLCDAAL